MNNSIEIKGLNKFYGKYLDHFQNLVQNRLLIAGISLVLILLTILIYEAKRKGKFGGNAFFQKAVSGIRNRKNQSQA